jgi:hypothetical protein
MGVTGRQTGGSTMKLVYAALIALVVAGSPAWAAAAVTAPASGQSAYSTWSMPAMHAVQGKVKSVSPDGKTVTLSNGMTLEVPSNLSIEQLSADIHGHPLITATYRVDSSGQKILEHYSIETGPLI